jgi:hypothetical protein
MFEASGPLVGGHSREVFMATSRRATHDGEDLVQLYLNDIGHHALLSRLGTTTRVLEPTRCRRLLGFDLRASAAARPQAKCLAGKLARVPGWERGRGLAPGSCRAASAMSVAGYQWCGRRAER